MAITAETNLDTAKINDGAGNLPWYYVEYDDSTGAIKTDHGFGKLPAGSTLKFNYDPKTEPTKRWDKSNGPLKYGDLDASLIATIDCGTSAIRKKIRDEWIGKRFSILLSIGRDGDLTSFTPQGGSEESRSQENIYFIPRVEWKIKEGWELPDKKTIELEGSIMKPIKSITLEGDSTALPSDLADVWGLEPTKLADMSIVVNPDISPFNDALVIKTR